MKAFIPRKDARGFIMPNFIFDDIELNCGSKLLFTMLCDYARDKNFCYPSRQTLARRLNVSLNTLKTWLQQLIAMGYVETKRTLRGLTFFLFSPVSFYKKESKIDSEEKITTCNNNEKLDKKSNFDGKVSKTDTEDKVNNLNILTPPIIPQLETQAKKKIKECMDNFEKYWQAYPKKENKEKARKIFYYQRKNKKTPSFELFTKALEFFSQDAKWQRENGRFIPQLHNFLKDLRWQEYTDFLKEKSTSLTEQQKSTCKAKPESAEKKDERFRLEKIEKEKSEKRQAMLKEAWEVFKQNFCPDSTFNRFAAERNFYRYYAKNNALMTVKSSQNSTAYEYMKLFNLME